MIKTTVKITDKRERQRRLERVARASRGSYATCGVKDPDEFYPESNVTVGQVAAWMEFGTATAPSRSFLRTPVDQADGLINKLRDRMLEAIITEQISIAQALETLGFFVSNRMKNAIYRGISPPLAEATVENKRRDRPIKGVSPTPTTPLMDTGLLVSKISYEVYLAGGSGE